MSKPNMYIFAGVNGAGKSSLTRRLADQAYYIIDPDAIAKELNLNSSRAGRETINRVKYCIDNRISFTLETTLSGKTIFSQIDAANAAGFSTTMLFVGLDSISTHLERIRDRVSQGGHNIPEEDVRRRHPRTLDNLLRSISHVEMLHVFDNSVELRHVLSIMRGKLLYIDRPVPNWAEPLIPPGGSLGSSHFFN